MNICDTPPLLDLCISQAGTSKKSTMPVINTELTLKHRDAFPGFLIPTLSMAHGHKDPVISMPNHTKFFLLRTLCNDLLQTNGLVYDDMSDGGTNVLTAALLTGQAYLLNFGFQSTIDKIGDMCLPNAKMLDGRRDQVQPGKAFDPPDLRYRGRVQHSEAVVGIKKAIIDEYFDLANLRVNYRLALVLGEFKGKLEELRAKAKSKNRDNSKIPKSMRAKQGKLSSLNTLASSLVSSAAEEDATIAEWAGGFEVYSLFEGLFRKELPRQEDDDDDDDDLHLLKELKGAATAAGGGQKMSKHDSHELEFGKLSNKPDFDDVLMDTLLYDDDKLMVR